MISSGSLKSAFLVVTCVCIWISFVGSLSKPLLFANETPDGVGVFFRYFFFGFIPVLLYGQGILANSKHAWKSQKWQFSNLSTGVWISMFPKEFYSEY